MKKILVNIINDTLRFSYKEKQLISDSLLNTNIISDNELIFSDAYLINNNKIVSTFLEELVADQKIDRIICDTFEIASLILPLIKKNPHITTIYIREEDSLPFKICEQIVKNKYIKYLECYSIPSFMIEMLDRKKIRVESRSEIFYTSRFMQENGLTQYSKIYYKMNARITLPLKDDDKEDFNTFCKINCYLKTVHLSEFNRSDLEWILNSLTYNRLKDISILIYGNVHHPDAINYLKKIKKIYAKKYKINLKLVYSEDYLQNHLFEQVLVNTLKVCGLIICSMLLSMVGYVGISNYMSQKNVDTIGNEIAKTIEDAKKQEELEESDPNNIIDIVEDPIENKYIEALKSINPSVVGWLHVNDTNVDYPVVKHTDNKYYLTHDLYGNYDKNGWVFMDFRNDDKDLDKNTIIFGHNMYYSGVMFGTLHRAANKSWYTKEENLVISFNTVYKTMNWQIFSIYKIPKTSDYLKVAFDSDSEYQAYINMVTKRSLAKFNVPVSTNDHILTLSTCTGNNQRLVIHAKLIEE